MTLATPTTPVRPIPPRQGETAVWQTEGRLTNYWRDRLKGANSGMDSHMDEWRGDNPHERIITTPAS